jgi:threonine/homoserine/homoserine lactone efflux protein
MITALLIGISYGFAAGVSPGPLLGLVITQTLQGGWRAGNLVALAPLLSDLPIILLAVFLIGQLPHAALGWLGLVGGLYVISLGVEALRTTPTIVAAGPGPSAATAALALPAAEGTLPVLKRAVTINVLNPHPYLFWATAGAQLLIGSIASAGVQGAFGFLAGFYALLVGAKLLVALIVNRSRGWLQGRGYRRVLIASGILLVGLGALLAWDGVGALL